MLVSDMRVRRQEGGILNGESKIMEQGGRIELDLDWSPQVSTAKAWGCPVA